ncbi:MAG: 30S ribosome-binding factor RbfA [Desulfobulbaceae bacterium]|nr:30S ribosome-binding factor RbfA [Desulfobulbaceae bacterium]
MVAAKERSRFKLPDGLAATPKRRPVRVADAIRNELATLLLFKVKDPALQQVTIVHVEMSDDLSRAKIYYACAPEMEGKVSSGLQRAKGFMRSHLAKELRMRYAPELVFFSDPSIEYDEKMQKIFQEIASENEPGSV